MSNVFLTIKISKFYDFVQIYLTNSVHAAHLEKSSFAWVLVCNLFHCQKNQNDSIVGWHGMPEVWQGNHLITENNIKYQHISKHLISRNMSALDT